MADPAQPMICPFCKARNDCQVHGKGPCWCADLNIPPDLLELVPSRMKNRTCICLTCLQDYQADPAAFILKVSG